MTEHVTGNENNQWDEQLGYNAYPDIERLFIEPDTFSVDISVFTQEDWRKMGELSSVVATLRSDFDFSEFEKYLDVVSVHERETLQELILRGVLPTELLTIRNELLQLSRKYSGAIDYHDQPVPSTKQDIKDKAILLVSLELLRDGLYCVSDEGLSSFLFEEEEPPTIDELVGHLTTLKTLYSQFFDERIPVLAIDYVKKQYEKFKDGADKQKQFLEKNESDETKEIRREWMEESKRLAGGFQQLIIALQE